MRLLPAFQQRGHPKLHWRLTSKGQQMGEDQRVQRPHVRARRGPKTCTCQGSVNETSTGVGEADTRQEEGSVDDGGGGGSLCQDVEELD